MQITDPHIGLVSFQHGLQDGILDLAPVSPHKDLFSHFDTPTPGVGRLTYVRLTEDQKTVKAFLVCVMNGQVNGFPCVAIGYAVPKIFRNQGSAKQIFRDVIQDQIFQAEKNGHIELYVEAVIDVENVSSQRVAEAVLSVERENITDAASGQPAFRYTAHFKTKTAS